jgi:mitochondrial import receptor subunit TOM20
VTAALDIDVQTASTHCTHCFRAVNPETVVKPDEDPLSSVFCSNDCLVASQNQSHNLIFSLNTPVPSSIPFQPLPPQAQEERRKAQGLLVQFIEKEQRTAPVLIARFVGRQVQAEFAKYAAGAGKQPEGIVGEYPDAENGDYALADHVERLRYIEVTPAEEEFSKLTAVLSSAMPGLDQFLTDDRHSILAGKIAYNAFGVYFEEGRDDKVIYTS